MGHRNVSFWAFILGMVSECWSSNIVFIVILFSCSCGIGISISGIEIGARYCKGVKTQEQEQKALYFITRVAGINPPIRPDLRVTLPIKNTCLYFGTGASRGSARLCWKWEFESLYGIGFFFGLELPWTYSIILEYTHKRRSIWEGRRRSQKLWPAMY